MADLIVGIDLGTTNSEVAGFLDGRVQVLGPGNKILPSCVGFSAGGELLVGESARNQLALYPDRTIRSIKRRMGSSESVMIAGKSFSPTEVSSLILRELVGWAKGALGGTPNKAVITVPAYFSDAQRAATREAGALAGLEVVRILNEPTAASLAYGYAGGGRHTALVYDLGGGTFDVSVVSVEGEITEVLASHGNNRLGGDDFDDLLAAHLCREFERQHGIDVRQGNTPGAKARLWWAAEEAKKKLSSEVYVQIREESVTTRNGRPLHLEMEISRKDYEDMIRGLVESTLDSVSKALSDSGRKPSDMDAVLLVGGSTRTPLVFEMLRERIGIEPRQDVHPDLCVALGAGVLASRLSGRDAGRVLVDVSPYSFGISFLGERGGVPYPHCYKPIIRRNTPLPLTRSEEYSTSHPFQTEVDLQVYQGEDEDALKNIPVGNFTIEGLTGMSGANEMICRMRLDLDGILEVTAVEKRTGKSKRITIDNALKAKSDEEIRAARKRLEEMFQARAEALEHDHDHDHGDEDWDPEGWNHEELSALDPALSEMEAAFRDPLPGEDVAVGLVERSRKLLERMHAEDREEAVELHERIHEAIKMGDVLGMNEAARGLKELLFFMEGRPN